MLLFFTPAFGDWIKQDVGTLAWLHSIYFLNEKVGWIVGSNGTYLSTTDGGKSWRTVKGISKDNIRDVYFVDLNRGWLLCERAVYAFDGKPVSYLLRTDDGGNEWRPVKFVEGRDRIVRFAFAKNGAAFAFGEGGVIWRRDGNNDDWKRIELPVRYLILGGTFLDNERAVLVGKGGSILVTENAGLVWSRSTIVPEYRDARFHSIFFWDSMRGWAVGDQGFVLNTKNGGRTWSEQVSASSRTLADVAFATASEGFAVGDGGTILRTVSGGEIWIKEENPSVHNLERVYLLKDRAYSVGFGGTVLTRELGN